MRLCKQRYKNDAMSSNLCWCHMSTLISTPCSLCLAVRCWLLIWPVQWHSCCSQFLSMNDNHSLPKHKVHTVSVSHKKTKAISSFLNYRLWISRHQLNLHILYFLNIKNGTICYHISDYIKCGICYRWKAEFKAFLQHKSVCILSSNLLQS